MADDGIPLRGSVGFVPVDDRFAGPRPRRFTEAPEDFRFAAAAAEFGLLLRGSSPRGDAGYAAVRATARAALGVDADGRRTEFLALVDAADRLTADRKLTHRT